MSIFRFVLCCTVKCWFAGNPWLQVGSLDTVAYRSISAGLSSELSSTALYPTKVRSRPSTSVGPLQTPKETMIFSSVAYFPPYIMVSVDSAKVGYILQLIQNADPQSTAIYRVRWCRGWCQTADYAGLRRSPPLAARTRATCKAACANRHKEICRCQGSQWRTSYWSSPTSPFALLSPSPIAQRVATTRTIPDNAVCLGPYAPW